MSKFIWQRVPDCRASVIKSPTVVCAKSPFLLFIGSLRRLTSHHISTVHLCIQLSTRLALQYLTDLCWPVSVRPGRQHLRSVRHGQLDVPRYQLTTYKGRSFICAAAATWNSLTDSLCHYLVFRITSRLISFITNTLHVLVHYSSLGNAALY